MDVVQSICPPCLHTNTVLSVLAHYARQGWQLILQLWYKRWFGVWSLWAEEAGSLREFHGASLQALVSMCVFWDKCWKIQRLGSTSCTPHKATSVKVRVLGLWLINCLCACTLADCLKPFLLHGETDWQTWGLEWFYSGMCFSLRTSICLQGSWERARGWGTAGCWFKGNLEIAQCSGLVKGAQEREGGGCVCRIRWWV